MSLISQMSQLAGNYNQPLNTQERVNVNNSVSLIPATDCPDQQQTPDQSSPSHVLPDGKSENDWASLQHCYAVELSVSLQHLDTTK